jgi:hypothetical protein
MVEIDGVTMPLDDCGWMLRRSCGCVTAVMTASWNGNVEAADEESAWLAFYADERPRKRKIEQAKRAGYTVALTTRRAASEEFRKPCPHRGGESA